MIEIKISGETPVKAMAECISLASRLMESKEATLLAKELYDADHGRDDAAYSESAAAARAAVDAPKSDAATISDPASAPSVMNTQSSLFEAPVPLAPVAAPAPAPAPAAPIPAPSAPVAVPTAAPSYNLNDIMAAGARFISAHPDKQDQLNALFPQFGITTLADLRPEQMGAFATAMRAVGVAI